MKNNFYISFGVWLIIISLLGVPIVWRDTLVALSGIFLVLVSVGPAILKKLQTKPKKKFAKPSDANSSNWQEPSKPELKFSDESVSLPGGSTGSDSVN